MTHEQKPGSVEFRTRRDQLASYPETVCVGRYAGDSWQLEISEDDLDPDQLIEGPVMYVRCDIDHNRREDAERVSGYVRPGLIEFFHQSQARFTSASIVPVQDETHTEPLYTSPANVSALKDRVKELEGALKEAAYALERVKDGERGGYNSRNGKFVSLQMSDGERADIIHSEVTEDCERALVTVRAAIREGGEHG